MLALAWWLAPPWNIACIKIFAGKASPRSNGSCQDHLYDFLFSFNKSIWSPGNSLKKSTFLNKQLCDFKSEHFESLASQPRTFCPHVTSCICCIPFNLNNLHVQNFQFFPLLQRDTERNLANSHLQNSGNLIKVTLRLLHKEFLKLRWGKKAKEKYSNCLM